MRISELSWWSIGSSFQSYTEKRLISEANPEASCPSGIDGISPIATPVATWCRAVNWTPFLFPKIQDTRQVRVNPRWKSEKIVLGGLTVLMASGRYACLSFKIDFFQGWLDLLLWIGPRKAYHDVNLKPGLINPTIFQNRMQNLHAECTVLNLCRNQTNVTESWHTHTYIYIHTYADALQSFI